MSDPAAHPDPAGYALLRELFHELSDLAGEARAARLDALQRENPAAAASLRDLLDRAAAQGGWLEQAVHPDLRRQFLDAMLEEPRAAAEAIVGEVAPYQILGELGRSAAAVVFKACREGLEDPIVALKVLLPSSLNGPSMRRQFQAEQKALAMMHHPHIARVHELGLTARGQPFLAMECIEGGAITEYARRIGLDIRSRLDLFLQVCEAMQHAHQRGVIHRDVKPSNILVSVGNGAAAAKVIDFGVAKAIGRPLIEATLQTERGELLGTLAYMSPEQLLGDTDDVDTRADVYGLGVVLFELLAGHAPFPVDGRTLVETTRAICDPDTPAPRLGTIDAFLRGDLETIVCKAIEKDRSRRYESVAELAADLRRHLSGKPILARQLGSLERLTRLAKRHKTSLALLAACLAIVIGLLAQTYMAMRESRRGHDRARELAESLVRDVVARLVDTAGAAEVRRTILLEVLTQTEGYLQQDSEDVGLRMLLAETLTRLGDIEREQGRHKEALALQQRYLSVAAALASSQPGHLEAQRLWSIALVKNADLAKESGHVAQALWLYQEALTLDERLAAAWSADRSCIDALAWSCERVGDLLYRLGDEEGALALHRRRLELAVQVCKMAPDRPGATFGLYMAHSHLAGLAGQDGNDNERGHHMQAAYELARGLAQREPGNRQYAVALVRSLRGIAADDLNAGRIELAMQRANEVRQLIWPMVESDPEHLDGLEAAATIHSLFADAAARCGDWPQALREYREAQSILEKIRSRRPDNPIHRMHLFSVHGSLEAAAQAIGDEALQRASRDAMAAICREVLADPKAAAGDLAGCAQWWATNHLVAEQDRAMALAGAERAAEQTGRRMPRMQLALAEVQWRVGQHEEALATLDEAIAATPRTEPARPQLLEAWQRLSNFAPTATLQPNRVGGRP